MKEEKIQFGYYPKKLDISVGNISISTLDSIDETVRSIKESKNVFRGWVYAPRVQYMNFNIGQKSPLPYNSRVFGLPKTHELKHKKSCGTDHLNFLIRVLGFFVGMRLTSTKAGFLDSTPIEGNRLVDFVLSNNSLENSIKVSENFWQKYKGVSKMNCKDNSKMIRRVNGLIQAFFRAQNPQFQEIERVLMLYIVLDTCYACLKEIKSGVAETHAKRIEWMCEQLEIKTPCWAVPNKGERKNQSTVSIIRNALIHEALFFDESFEEPFGYLIEGNDATVRYPKNLTLEMGALICRIFVCLLVGNSNDYVKSCVNTRQIFELKIE